MQHVDITKTINRLKFRVADITAYLAIHNTAEVQAQSKKLERILQTKSIEDRLEALLSDEYDKCTRIAVLVVELKGIALTVKCAQHITTLPQLPPRTPFVTPIGFEDTQFCIAVKHYK